MTQIGEILTELREDNGLTQGDLAKLLHVSVSSISAYESGKRIPSIDVLTAYARYYDVSTDYILGLTKSTESISVFSEEIVPGKTINEVIADIKKLRPDQREALVITLNSMAFYADITSKTNMNGGRHK